CARHIWMTATADRDHFDFW
nr:immunoglobulin heavy chain junction region [Macaca mulatta]MOX15341.1 immunoglobulin heavy chain junction region [Macaca mulatta]MOX15506.1 immunoglobulin heavy chain junction region [Macaca mulatta]MOX15629.1 immunoglobulin heavy chain junction region [Macaca mulatta]